MSLRSEDVTDMVDRYDYDAALAAIGQLVDEGVGIDEIQDTRYSGNPPIWIRMLEGGREDAAKFAVLAGADVNAKTSSGKPVLVVAAEKGFREIVQLLIDRGADVNTESTYGSPLLAAAKGHGDVVDLLLASGANVNGVNKYGHTPLMAAAQCGDVTIMRRLVALGAQANAMDARGRGCMYYAAANENTAAAEYLATVGAGSVRPERFQAIVSFSRRPMSDWDAGELHREIADSQFEIGRMKDTAVFKAENVVAGTSIDDMQYVYAALRESLAGIGGDELISRCYVHDFAASSGNSGMYVILLDQSIDLASAPGGSPLTAYADSVRDSPPRAADADSAPDSSRQAADADSVPDSSARAADVGGGIHGKGLRSRWRRR